MEREKRKSPLPAALLCLPLSFLYNSIYFWGEVNMLYKNILIVSDCQGIQMESPDGVDYFYRELLLFGFFIYLFIEILFIR